MSQLQWSSSEEDGKTSSQVPELLGRAWAEREDGHAKVDQKLIQGETLKTGPDVWSYVPRMYLFYANRAAIWEDPWNCLVQSRGSCRYPQASSRRQSSGIATSSTGRMMRWTRESAEAAPSRRSKRQTELSAQHSEIPRLDFVFTGLWRSENSCRLVGAHVTVGHTAKNYTKDIIILTEGCHCKARGRAKRVDSLTVGMASEYLKRTKASLLLRQELSLSPSYVLKRAVFWLATATETESWDHQWESLVRRQRMGPASLAPGILQRVPEITDCSIFRFDCSIFDPIVDFWVYMFRANREFAANPGLPCANSASFQLCRAKLGLRRTTINEDAEQRCDVCGQPPQMQPRLVTLTRTEARYCTIWVYNGRGGAAARAGVRDRFVMKSFLAVMWVQTVDHRKREWRDAS